MSNLASKKIRVFPFGRNRGIIDPHSRVLNEYNISNLVRMLTDSDNYVVSYNSTDSKMEFVIHGYYFSADLTDVIKQGQPLYATIQLATATNVDPPYEYLSGGDTEGENTQFTGVTFTTEQPKSGLWLQLLDNNREVPQTSYVRFKGRSISNALIDIETIRGFSANEMKKHLPDNR